MLQIYGPSDKRDLLEPLLVWATPGQRGFSSGGGGRGAAGGSAAGSSKAHRKLTKAEEALTREQQEALQKAAELKQMLGNLERVDDEGRRSSLLDTLCST